MFFMLFSKFISIRCIINTCANRYNHSRTLSNFFHEVFIDVPLPLPLVVMIAQNGGNSTQWGCILILFWFARWVLQKKKWFRSWSKDSTKFWKAITLSCSLIAQKRILSALQLILLFKFLKLQGLSILQTFTFSRVWRLLDYVLFTYIFINFNTKDLTKGNNSVIFFLWKRDTWK